MGRVASGPTRQPPRPFFYCAGKMIRCSCGRFVSQKPVPQPVLLETPYGNWLVSATVPVTICSKGHLIYLASWYAHG